MDASAKDKKWVQEFLIPNLLKNGKLVKDYSESNPFVLGDVCIEYLGIKESFMLTICYKVKINFEYCGKKYSNALVVKQTPNIVEDAYEAVNFDTLFHNEIRAYTEIMPALGCSDNYPKYFYSHRKKLEAVIVLGDFTIDGWRMTKSRVNLSLEHILLSVKHIAQFHGKAYALKQSDPSQFHAIISSLKEARYARDLPKNWAEAIEHCIERTIKATRELKSEIPEEFLRNLSKLISDAITYCKEKVKPIEPLATLCHGDYLRNNLAFKYDATEDIPTDVMMFDFQTLRYSSPMVDLSVLMSLSCGKDVRSKLFNRIFNTYWNELVTTYCDQVAINLKDLPKFLSYGNLLKEYILWIPYGIVTASSFLMNLHEPEDIDPADMLQRSPEETLADALVRGGKTVDMELAAIVEDLYAFTVKYDMNIFKEL